MALTKDFKETIQARVESDPAFRKKLLKEGVERLLSGDVDTGSGPARLHQRHHRLGCAWRPNGQVAQEPHAHVRPGGEPQARNLFEVIGYLQKREGLHFEVRAVLDADLARGRSGGRPPTLSVR